MKRIATLGPKGTFSDVATIKYVEAQNESYEVHYFSSIKKALDAIGNGCDYGVLPVENFSEGFIPLVLDHLLETNVFVVNEIILPIRFSFVSYAKSLDDIDKVFVQFVAKGQCSEFLEAFKPSRIVSTESNIESLRQVETQEGLNGAVVPALSFDPGEFELVVNNVNDYRNNQTRFLVLSDKQPNSHQPLGENSKTSIVILDDEDYPGLLSDILASFSKRNINLTSIMSRPTRQKFGKYHFFIDLDGHITDTNVTEALKEIQSMNKVKVVGSYPRADIIHD